MTTLRTAAQQALEAMELGYDSAKAEADQYHAAMAGYRPQRHAQMDADVQKIAAAITALKAALAEPTLTQQMTDAGFTPRDNRLTCDECGGKFTRQMLPIHKCAALAEPVQEPVAQVHPNHLKPTDDGKPWCREVLLYSGDHNGDLSKGENYRVKLYTAPPQRKPEPMQEPVAWIYQNSYTEQEYLVWKKGTGGRNWVPLYAAPPQRKPLSAVDLRALYDQHAAYQEEGPEASGWWEFARAIERAHGIGGDK